MLKKLLKYEWKDTYRLLLPINLAIILITLIGCTILNTSIFNSDTGFLLAAPLLILYVLSIITFSCTTLVYIYVRFYKNLYTAEGYLMHTLPVTPTQLFHSKLIVGYFWFFLNSLLTALSTSALSAALGIQEAATAVFGDMQDSLLDSFLLDAGQSPEAFSFADLFGYPLPVFVLLLFAMLLISSFSSVVMGYMSVLLGQRMERNKLAASVAFYFGIYMVIQIITSLSIIIPEIANTGKYMGEELPANFLAESFRLLFPSLIISYLVLNIIFYVVCRLLLKGKVNLD